MQSSVQFNFQTQTQYKQFLHQTSDIKKKHNSNAQIRTFSIKSNFSNKNKHNFFYYLVTVGTIKLFGFIVDFLFRQQLQ